MAVLVYIVVGVILVSFLLFFLTAFALNSVDRPKLRATPTIPRSHAVLTSFGSTTIRLKADKVFDVLTDFEGYSKWTTALSGYEWDNMNEDGWPSVGGKGRFLLSLEGFNTRVLPCELTLWDEENMMIAERSTHYGPWLLGSERVQEVVPIEGSKDLCEYRTWQTVSGILAYALILLANDELSELQQRRADDLKKFLEGRT